MEAPTVIDVPTDVVSSSTVTPDGAVIQADGVTVTVPAGGVASPTTVVVTRLKAPFYMNPYARPEPNEVSAIAVGPTYDFGPAGVQFTQPVEVTLPYDPQHVPDGTDPGRVGAAYFNGDHWVVAGGTVDPVAHTVTVRLRAFEGIVVEVVELIILAGLIATNIGIRVHHYYGGEGISEDPITRKEVKDWITPSDPVVKTQASTATVDGVSLGDQEKLAAYLEKHGAGETGQVMVTGPDGQPRGSTYSKGPGTNWQKPTDYLTKGNMEGDCTDVTNAMVSIFRSAGYPAKGVFGYRKDDKGLHPHAWGEVRIGNATYIIDEEGRLQPLGAAMTAIGLVRPQPGDPRDAMWDENGQDPYPQGSEAAWWAEPIVLTRAIVQAAPDDALWSLPFKSIEIAGTARPSGGFDLAVDKPGIPVHLSGTTQGISYTYTGTGHFSMHGRSDAAGAVTGTFTWQVPDLLININGRLTFGGSLTWKGGVKGAISRTGAALTFSGSYAGVCKERTVQGLRCVDSSGSTSLRVTFDVIPGP